MTLDEAVDVLNDIEPELQRKVYCLTQILVRALDVIPPGEQRFILKAKLQAMKPGEDAGLLAAVVEAALTIARSRTLQ